MKAAGSSDEPNMDDLSSSDYYDLSSSDYSSKKTAKKPKYSKFNQQELPACKPILTPGLIISALALLGIIFVLIGLTTLFASESVVELNDRYDEDCIPKGYGDKPAMFIQTISTNKTCTRELIVRKRMRAPIFIYYELENFYQNHRLYVTSRSANQLLSKAGEDSVGGCIHENSANKQPIVPCGLVAWSLFNDTYKFAVKKVVLEVNKKNIAWKSDERHKFGPDVYPKNFQTGRVIGGAKLNSTIPLSEQEDLMVWMRTAALPTFRKLYGKIEADLQANDVIEVKIENNYNSYGYGGKKRLVLSTTTWTGGKNNALGIAYLAVGGLSFFFAISFILMYVYKPRPVGDPSYLSWNKIPSGHEN